MTEVFIFSGLLAGEALFEVRIQPTRLISKGTWKQGQLQLFEASASMDLPGKIGERRLRNQEVFYGKREQTDARVST